MRESRRATFRAGSACLLILTTNAACTGQGRSSDEGQTRTDTASVPARPTTSVPFESVRDQIVIEVMIGGDGPFTMLVDTAVDPSAIDLATAERIGLSIDRSATGQATGTGSDVVAVFPTEIDALDIGGATFPAFAALAIDLTGVSEGLGRPLHGVLGVSFLEDRSVRIDYPAARVEVFSGAAPVVGAGPVFQSPFYREMNDIYIEPVHVNGEPIRVLLDTGSSLALELNTQAVERLGLEAVRASAEAGTVIGARGEAGILTSSVDSVRLGPLLQTDVDVVFPERDGLWDGKIGNALLRPYVLTVDYVRERVSIAPAGDR